MLRRRWIAAIGFLALSAAKSPAQTPSPAPVAPAPAATAPAAGNPVAAAPVGPAPKIHFDSTNLDLGNVKKGDDAVAEFVFKNEGDAPLKILSAKPG